MSFKIHSVLFAGGTGLGLRMCVLFQHGMNRNYRICLTFLVHVKMQFGISGTTMINSSLKSPVFVSCSCIGEIDTMP